MIREFIENYIEMILESGNYNRDEITHDYIVDVVYNVLEEEHIWDMLDSTIRDYFEDYEIHEDEDGEELEEDE